jgi:hypothetical protein
LYHRATNAGISSYTTTVVFPEAALIHLRALANFTASSGVRLSQDSSLWYRVFLKWIFISVMYVRYDSKCRCLLDQQALGFMNYLAHPLLSGDKRIAHVSLQILMGKKFLDVFQIVAQGYCHTCIDFFY